MDIKLEYSLALSKELNHLDLTFESNGVRFKNYWFRIALDEKKTFARKSHAHSFYEIHLCLNGWAKIRIDGKENILRKGSFILLSKNQIHQIYEISDDFEKIVWGFDLMSVVSGNECNESELVRAYHILKDFCIAEYNDGTILLIYFILENLREKKLGWYESIKKYLYCFLTELTRIILKGNEIVVETEKVLQKHSTEMEAVKTYISDNLQNKVTVEEVATQMAMSKRHLFRICFQEYGITVGNFIKRTQMEKAKQLIEETNISIDEIAEKVGYSDRFAFSKAFLSYEGMSPSKFRSSLKK